MDHIARQLTSEAAKTKFLARVARVPSHPSSKIGGSIGSFISTRRPSTCGLSRAYDRRVREPKTRGGGFPKIDPRQERMIERIGRLLVDRMSVIEEADMSPAPARRR
jgi:hypothetical protein